MEQLVHIFRAFIEPIGIVVILIVILLLNSWIFKRINSTKLYGSIIKNSIATLAICIAIIILILNMPIDKALKGQILSFIAIIISAGIALSSTTVLGNLIAGIMNNSMNRFRNGDLIKIGDFQGRVTKKSIFHTEIQLEDSNFITIPNLYIAINPVKLTRKSDTVISTSVSLGYDVPRTLVEKSLNEAAVLSGLNDPYVYVTSLGDFSVVYKIHGFLEDSSIYFSKKSLLNANVMDVLHKTKIEIVSPSFMNQRIIGDKSFIPTTTLKNVVSNDKQTPEELIFDEAIKSEKIEIEKDQLKELIEQKEELIKNRKTLIHDKEIQNSDSALNNIDSQIAIIQKHIAESGKEDAQ